VYNYWDRGLLGMTLDPGFTTGRPFVYVLYTSDSDLGGQAPKWGQPNTDADPGSSNGSTTVTGKLSKLTASGNVMSGGEQVLIHDWQNQFPSHSIGDLSFGPDGYLYASSGDGASFNAVDYGQTDNPFNDPVNEGGAVRSQDILSPNDSQTLDGTVIRIDADTGNPAPNNPFANLSQANQKRIIATGLRNPYRFTFRPGTSEIWIAETGWSTYEEINRITNAADASAENFGWPAYEGPVQQTGYKNANLPLLQGLLNNPSLTTMPWFSYAHSEKVDPASSEPTGGSSPTGIAFYNGGAFPAAYDDAMFFAEYSRKQIYVMYRGLDGLPDKNTRQVFVPLAGRPSTSTSARTARCTTPTSATARSSASATPATASRPPAASSRARRSARTARRATPPPTPSTTTSPPTSAATAPAGGRGSTSAPPGGSAKSASPRSAAGRGDGRRQVPRQQHRRFQQRRRPAHRHQRAGVGVAHDRDRQTPPARAFATSLRQRHHRRPRRRDGVLRGDGLSVTYFNNADLTARV
jgi:glucose/arabinose dehydrogenase